MKACYSARTSGQHSNAGNNAAPTGAVLRAIPKGLLYASRRLPALLKLEADGTKAASLAGSPEEQANFIYRETASPVTIRICPDAKLTRSNQRHGARRERYAPGFPKVSIPN